MRFSVLAVAAVCACSPFDEEAIETCKEFSDRVFDHLDECGGDSEQARADFAEQIDCDRAVEVQGDPLACAAEFEDVPCDEVSAETVNETLGTCDGEILVLKDDD